MRSVSGRSGHSQSVAEIGHAYSLAFRPGRATITAKMELKAGSIRRVNLQVLDAFTRCCCVSWQHGGVRDLLWDDVKVLFDPELDGSLPDVHVPGTTIDDWQALVDLV